MRVRVRSPLESSEGATQRGPGRRPPTSAFWRKTAREEFTALLTWPPRRILKRAADIGWPIAHTSPYAGAGAPRCFDRVGRVPDRLFGRRRCRSADADRAALLATLSAACGGSCPGRHPHHGVPARFDLRR